MTHFNSHQIKPMRQLKGKNELKAEINAVIIGQNSNFVCLSTCNSVTYIKIWLYLK